MRKDLYGLSLRENEIGRESLAPAVFDYRYFTRYLVTHSSKLF